MSRSRRSVLAGLATATASLAGCSDEDDEEPGLYAVDTLTLYRDGDGWYEYPDEAGVQVTVENTDVDRHRGTLVVTLRGSDGGAVGEQQREVELPGGTTRSYRFAVPVDADGTEVAYTAAATVEP